MKRSYQKGITLIEVLISISIVAVMVVAVGFSVTTYVNARAELLSDLKGVYLAEEGYEIVRALRDEDWSAFEALSVGAAHYLDVATTTIDFGGTPEIIDGDYVRSFVLTPVYRDGDDDVVLSTEPGATIDDEARYVEVRVAGPTGTSSFTGLLTNLDAI